MPFAMHKKLTLLFRYGFGLLCLSLAISPQSAWADHLPTCTGVAVVQDTSTLVINGEKIALWGIDALAPDQKCWQGETPWNCGEEASMALKHFAEGKLITCDVQHPADEDGPARAKCYRLKGEMKKDIVEYLIRRGWAMDRGETSGGAYFAVEQEAQADKRGVWGSRFQTAQDWKDGIQRFVGEDEMEQQAPDAALPQE